MSLPLTIGKVADHFGVSIWQVRRLYERHLLPEPQRIGMFRMVEAQDLPKVREALVEAGYLKAETGELA